MQVLVTEDEVLIRMLICDMVERAGHTCIPASNAAEALALLDGGHCRPDLMVTDFNLGRGLNGKELAREVVRRLPALAIVFVTGNPDAFDHHSFRPQERFVPKPFAEVQLMRAIQELTMAVPSRVPGQRTVPRATFGVNPASLVLPPCAA